MKTRLDFVALLLFIVQPLVDSVSLLESINSVTTILPVFESGEIVLQIFLTLLLLFMQNDLHKISINVWCKETE